MAVSDSFKNFLAEQFVLLGPVEIRRMFGGAGAFVSGKIFALIDDDVLYFKVDASTIAPYDAEGMGPFTYPSKNGPMTMDGYRRAPERLFDEPDELIAWAKAAMAVAERSGVKKPGKSKSAASKVKAPGSTRRKPT